MCTTQPMRPLPLPPGTYSWLVARHMSATSPCSHRVGASSLRCGRDGADCELSREAPKAARSCQQPAMLTVLSPPSSLHVQILVVPPTLSGCASGRLPQRTSSVMPRMAR